MMFKIGDKVVPISKSVGSPHCGYRDKVKNGDLEYLYVVGFDKIDKKVHIVSQIEDTDKSGNYYLEGDLIPYNQFGEVEEL